MRSFTDNTGTVWQVALLEGSWGSTRLVFTRAGCGDVLQQELPAANQAQAMQMLTDMSEAELQQALAEAQPWDGST